MNCLGQGTANLYAPTTRAYIVDGLLLICSSRHHQAGMLPFYFFWCSSPPIFSLCTFCKLTWYFTISRIFNEWSRGHTFFNHHIEFCPHRFCLLPFLRCTSNFLAPFSSAMCTLLFLVPVFFLPDLIFFLPFFPQWNFSSSSTFFVIHKFTLSLFRLTSINSENRLFAHNCPLGRKFRRILVVYNYLKTK